VDHAADAGSVSLGGGATICTGFPFVAHDHRGRTPDLQQQATHRRVFLHPPEAEISTLLLFTLKEMGGFALMLSMMLFLAFRDPARNVVIIDAFTAALCMLAVTPLISFYTLDIQRIYPGHLVWGRSLIRLGLAAVLFYLRPRETHWKPAGHF
jgi:hypothetical protein